ncbi:ATP-binding protein [Trichocoleus sp. FACHB-90]|uniref:AAA family ATPase n=1 Tax=Cyanophyceae TaxID=3028117 RepID=UPI001682A49E|nr:ATP-binding protein [Trichocoleus sp. FACHB-90]
MLKQISFENWKSYRSAVLPIDPLTVLIGTNASGKSNALDALEFLTRTVRGKEIQAALSGDAMLPSIRGGIEWAAFKPENYFRLSVLVQGEDGKIDYLYSIMVRTVQRLQLWSESLISLHHHNEQEKAEKIYLFQTEELLADKPGIFVQFYRKQGEIYKDFRRSNSILSQLNNFLLLPQETVEGARIVSQVLQNIFILNPIPFLMRDYSPLSDSLESDASNIAGVLAALPDKHKAEVESTLSTYVKHLPERDIQRVWAEPVGRFKTDAMLYCEELWKPGETTEIDARGMSDGTLRFLAILTALLTRPEGSQLVIEEVDNGLHPSRAGLLLKMLREIGAKRKIDILVTTHNPALLDALGPEMVPFLVVAHRDTETGESKLTLLEDIENLPKLMASGPLGKLATKGAIERSLSGTK